MAPSSTTQVLLSPAELSYLHHQLSITPPIRPDGRSPSQFRPLVAETGILPNTSGSARICFADGTEAIVGVKAELEKSKWQPVAGEHGLNLSTSGGDAEPDDEDQDEEGERRGRSSTSQGAGRGEWVEVGIEMPGYRDDDVLPTFLSSMLIEALLASGELKDRLWINNRFHWKLYVDILLLSQPLSYPLPLLSLTTHLALLDTRIPKLKSEQDEDPLFDDDWDAASLLYPYSQKNRQLLDRPPITLLVITVGPNIIFDPSKEELAVAEAVLALSVCLSSSSTKTGSDSNGTLKLIAIRAIDPPSRLTPPGIPNAVNTGETQSTIEEAFALRELAAAGSGVWKPPRGGMKGDLLQSITKSVLKEGGIAEEVLSALVSVQR